MRRNLKKAAAFGLAVLIGCMMPMGTMLAEESGETAVSVVSENDLPEEENSSDNETVSGEENLSGEENVSDEENVPDEKDASDGEDVPDGENAADVTDGEAAVSEGEDVPEAAAVALQQESAVTAVLTAEPEAETNDAQTTDSAAAPVISITRGGADKTFPLGGELTFEYTNNWGTMFDVSVSQNDLEITSYCYLDKVTDREAAAKTLEQMDSLGWMKQDPPMNFRPLRDGCYVVYIKVEAGGQNHYARSCGLVVDTVKPVIKEAVSGTVLASGQTYPKGTRFLVEDDNLDSVWVNQQPVTPENGSYLMVAKENSTSCEIKAVDKAGNEETYAITIPDSGSPGDDEEQPKPDNTVISESKD